MSDERDTTDRSLARLAARIGGYVAVVRGSPEHSYLVRRMPTLAAMLDEAERLSAERDRQTVRDDAGRDITA